MVSSFMVKLFLKNKMKIAHFTHSPPPPLPTITIPDRPISFQQPSRSVFNFKGKWSFSKIHYYIFGVDPGEPYTVATLLKTYINTISLLHWIPYTIQWSEGSGHGQYYLQEKWKFSKVICALFQIGLGVTQIFSVIEMAEVYSAYEYTAVIVFALISSLSEFAITFFVCKLLWFRKDDLVNLTNSLGERLIQAKSRFWRFQVCALATFIVAQNFIAGSFSLYQRQVLESVTSTMMKGTVSVFGWLYGSDDITSTTTFHIFHWCFKMWATWSQRLLSMSIQTVVIVGITLNSLANQFIEKLEEEERELKQTVQNIFYHVDRLKALNEKLNKNFSNIYFMFFVSTVSYYTTLPASLKRANQNAHRYWYRAIYAIVHSITWILTSEFYRKVQGHLRKWINKQKLSEDITQMDIGKLSLLSMEIQNDPVGISCRYFTVNYELLTSIIGLLVTYAALTLQL